MAIIDEVLLQIVDFAYHPYKALYGDLRKKYKAESARISMIRAERRGWLTKQVDGEQIYIKLTKKGMDKVKKLHPISKLMPWQKKEGGDSLCVVVFDIPEKNRAVRDLLRSKLRSAGFLGWQKSVWVGKNIDLEKLWEFIEEVGLKDFVLAFETSSFGNQKLERKLETFR